MKRPPDASAIVFAAIVVAILMFAAVGTWIAINVIFNP